MLKINGLVFKRAAPAPLSAGWYNGDWIDFSTIAGFDFVTYEGHSSRYDNGLVDMSYITIPEPDVMITEVWRMEVYQWGGNLRYFLKGKNTGKQFQSGRPWISVTPLSSIEDATAEQFNLFYNELAEKEEIILLTKTDLVDATTVTQAVKKFESFNKPVYALTQFEDEEIKAFGDALVQILRNDT
jgi:hypothetical protein